MESVERTHTKQIDAMSAVLYQQAQAIAELDARTTILGTNLQHAQLHLNHVDARVPASASISKVLLGVVSKVNEVIVRVRTIDATLERLREAEEREARVLLSDLEAINMELALGDFAPSPQNGGKTCAHEWNILCNDCFFASSE